MAVRQSWLFHSDSVIVWDSYGVVPAAGFPGGTSIDRFYPGWTIRCSPWDNVYVWNTAGEAVGPASATARSYTFFI